MKKVFFLNTCVAWGGGEKWTFETAQELDERGYEVIVGSVEESKLYQRTVQEGLETKVVNVKGTLSVLNPLKLMNFVNYLKDEKIDAIFLNLSQDLKFGGLAAKIAGVEKIIFRRGLDKPIKDKFYNKFLLKDCVTDIIVNSQATEGSILKHNSYYLDEEKINIIYNGIKVAEIDQAEIKNDIRKEFAIDKDEIIIANVGRLTEQKGHIHLIEAANLLKEQLNNFKVLIIGTGELEEDLKEIVKEKDLEDKIIFTGFRTDVYSILKQADFLVHTALWEGFGFVLAEAMAAGKAVVATEVSSISEVVQDAKTGFLVEVADVLAISEGMLNMIKKDQLRREMGLAGKKRVKNLFSFQKQIDKLTELMRER